ncbi:hypothetical protein [Pseudomonas putida]|nr:hypothetical protein [Pseudomonas putida]
MINDYIISSRRTKPRPEMSVQINYEKYYGWILGQVTPWGAPELVVTYSSDRRCELVRMGQCFYLIYDQYLGQTFNRLNRIQYARFGAAVLSQSYACKYVAESLLCLGQTGSAAFFAALYQQFMNNVKVDGNPFEPPRPDADIRYSLTGIQELFVMAHEVAHSRWCLDKDNLNKEVSRHIDEFICEGSGFYINASNSLSGYYKAALDQAPAGFLEEIFADDFGALIAFRVADRLGVPAWQRAAGVILAFKYMRLFRYLDLLAHRIAKLSAETDAKSFKRKIKVLKKDILNGNTEDIRLYQFREHFIRHRLRIACSRISSYDASDEVKISALIDDYETNTEQPIVLDLIDRLSKRLKFKVWVDLNKKISAHRDGVALVDEMTGWAK